MSKVSRSCIQNPNQWFTLIFPSAFLLQISPPPKYNTPHESYFQILICSEAHIHSAFTSVINIPVSYFLLQAHFQARQLSSHVGNSSNKTDVQNFAILWDIKAKELIY